MNNRKAKDVLVLGPPRNHTSFTTSVFVKNGFYPGKSLVSPNEYNKFGFYENFRIMKFNSKLIRDKDPQEQIETLVKEELTSYINVVKDPRIPFTKVYPHWLKVLNIDLVVICIRNPLNYYKSMKKLKFYKNHSKELLYEYWNRYVKYSLKFVQENNLNYKIFFTSYPETRFELYNYIMDRYKIFNFIDPYLSKEVHNKETTIDSKNYEKLLNNKDLEWQYINTKEVDHPLLHHLM